MTTWKMPGPPGDSVVALWDVYGEEWMRRDPTGEEWRLPGGEIISWESLVWRKGPLSDVPPSEQSA